ncbi:HD-GYP domain-containing protein [Moritella viscosa]
MQGHHDQIIDRVIEGEEKLVYISPVKVGVSSEEFFAVVIPKKVIYQKVNEQVKIAIFVTVIFMLLMLPLAWLFGAPIVRPIRQLRIETRKVQERRYDEVQLVDTAIKEVWELSEAMMDMSKDLQQYEAAQKEFLEAFIKLIAQAIDDKSKYTAGHCNRVPELGIMLAEVTEQCDSALFKDFKFANADEKREFRIAAWLHDCGKITTPEYIVDKGTKLEANYNRIHEVRTRFEVLWRDAEITALKQKIALPEHKSSIDAALKEKHKKLIDDFAFIAASNVGGEFMSDDKVARVKALSEQTWLRHFDDTLGLSSVEELVKKEALNPHFPVIEKLLSDKAEHIVERDRKVEFDPKFGIKMDVPEHQYNLGEVYNLTISRGTLTAEDRYKINEHMISTIKMLDNLPFPPELSRVPRYASTHHETLKGTGYPRKLTADDLSIPERILVIADIFEALTASDRPYKKAKPVSVAVDIMYKMALDQHLDIELFRLFLQSGTHIKYAQKYLKSEQIDEIDLSKYLQPEQLGEVDLSSKRNEYHYILTNKSFNLSLWFYLT